MVKKLTGSNFKHQWTELIEAVCKSDDDNCKWVSEYVEGKTRTFTLGNKRLRPIYNRLKRYVSAHKDKISALGLSPLTLAWRETYTGGDKEIDIDNVIDPEDIEEPIIPTPTPTPTPSPSPTVTTNDDHKGEELEGKMGNYGFKSCLSDY